MENKNEMISLDRTVSNLAALGLDGAQPRVRILWMYPDSLNIHGGRGDIMALLRFATMAKLPVEICRVDRFADPIPLEDAHMLYFCCGDLDCAADLCKALEPHKAALEAFAKAGKVMVANGSTGVVLGKDLQYLDGSQLTCLGLLGMHAQQRKTIHGDDLWLDAMDGVEVIGNEIKRVEITLDPEQQPFASVRYGRGNCGDGKEGAMAGNVIYTSCLGPMLVRNPKLAMELLARAASAAGLALGDLPAEALALEEKAFEEAKVFITKKLQK